MVGRGLCPGEIPGRRRRPGVGDVSDAVLLLGGNVEVHPLPLPLCTRVKISNLRIGRRRRAGVVSHLGGAALGLRLGVCVVCGLVGLRWRLCHVFSGNSVQKLAPCRRVGGGRRRRSACSRAEVFVLGAFFPGDPCCVALRCSRVSVSASLWYGAPRARARRQGPSSEVEQDGTQAASRWKLTKAGSLSGGVLVFSV